MALVVGGRVPDSPHVEFQESVLLKMKMLAGLGG